MRRPFTLSLLLLIAANLTGPQCLTAEAQFREVHMAARGIAGRDFPTAATIATLINRQHGRLGLRIIVTPRDGSVAIIDGVLSGKFYFGVAPMGHIHQAFRGVGAWEGRPQTRLRSLLNVQAEKVTLVASLESGIESLKDLKQRRIFIGGPDTDLRRTATAILQASGIVPESDLTLAGTAASEAPGMMDDHEIDAFFYIMGNMNRAFIDLVSQPAKVKLVPIGGPGVDQWIAANPFCRYAWVNIEHYPYFANHSDVQALGIKAGLITAAEADPDVTRTLVREVFAVRSRYEADNPSADVLTLKEMTAEMAAPVHPGAVRVYRQSSIPYSVYAP